MLLKTTSGLSKVFAHGLKFDAVFSPELALRCVSVLENSFAFEPGHHYAHQRR